MAWCSVKAQGQLYLYTVEPEVDMAIDRNGVHKKSTCVFCHKYVSETCTDLIQADTSSATVMVVLPCAT
jgi:hypothetical protein